MQDYRSLWKMHLVNLMASWPPIQGIRISNNFVPNLNNLTYKPLFSHLWTQMNSTNQSILGTNHANKKARDSQMAFIENSLPITIYNNLWDFTVCYTKFP